MAYKGLISAARELCSVPPGIRPTPVKTTGPLGAGCWRAVKPANMKGLQFSDILPLLKQRTITGRVKDMLAKSNVVRHSAKSLREKAYIVCVQIDEKLTLLSLVFAKQCNQILAMRVRRATQMASFYSKLGYDKDTIAKLIQKIGLSFTSHLLRIRQGTGKSLVGLFSAASLFSWKDRKIQDNELSETAGEITLIQMATPKSSHMNVDGSSSMLKGWEKVVDRETLTIYRKPLPDSTHLYEYKVFGSFKDIPARAFYNTQLDLEFRKQWDKLVVKLDVVDRDEKSGTEVVQWITHFPYPMYKREYVYLRRTQIDTKQKVMVIVSRHTDHPHCPLNNNYVRVDTYTSKMVIRPHGNSFDENGFDYILTYHDDPKSSIPSMAYNWMATTGVPDFVEKIHVAAKILHNKRKGIRPHDDSDYQKTSTEGIPM